LLHATPFIAAHLPGGGGGGGLHHSSYMGCLALSEEELVGNWTFSVPAPDCTYVHTESSGGDGEEE
jgi:hypothetical protein